jgi:hypothetical protein
MTKLVGLTRYGPASFHDLLSDDDLLAEGSSVGDVSSPSYLGLRECAMADIQGQWSDPAETEDMHTQPDPCTGALFLVHPRCNSKPNAHNVAGGAWARVR